MTGTRTVVPFEPLHGDTAGELKLAIARFDSRLRHAARAMADADDDVAEDLYQIAITHLWELDPSRFDRDDDGYLWQSMIRRMGKGRRAEEGDPLRPPLALRFP
jgi:DNA-directed RNA polymerase specialized sigma24 family protein